MRRLSAVLAVAGIAAIAVDVFAVTHASERSRPGADPVVFLKRVVAEIARNDYATAWRTMNPAQKRAAPFVEYVGCEARSPIPGHLASLKVLRVREEELVVPGTTARVTAVAATLRLVISEPALGEQVKIVHTVHAVAADGHWTWVLPPSRYELYRSDGCVGAGPAV